MIVIDVGGLQTRFVVRRHFYFNDCSWIVSVNNPKSIFGLLGML